jgi:hypothetical protein
MQLVAATVEEFYEHLPLLLEYLRRYSSTHTPHDAVVRREMLPVACCAFHALRCALAICNMKRCALRAGGLQHATLCVARWRFATCNAVRCALAFCSPEYVLTYRLLPGTMAIFDNHRVLHGRTAFSGQVATLCMNRHCSLVAHPHRSPHRTDRTMRRGATACN